MEAHSLPGVHCPNSWKHFPHLRAISSFLEFKTRLTLLSSADMENGFFLSSFQLFFSCFKFLTILSCNFLSELTSSCTSIFSDRLWFLSQTIPIALFLIFSCWSTLHSKSKAPNGDSTMAEDLCHLKIAGENTVVCLSMKLAFLSRSDCATNFHGTLSFSKIKF